MGSATSGDVRKTAFRYSRKSSPGHVIVDVKGERQPLLAKDPEGFPDDTEDQFRPPPHRRRTAVSAAILILILISAGFLRPFLSSKRHASAASSGDILFSNGTHPYRKTVLLVSIDGLRADYLDRGITPNLLKISRQGLRAKWMKPAFPTHTFPNHWSLMTALHPESHGIIANTFWDPETNSEFMYTDPKRCWNASWWGGEPIWETAERAGIITANLMWPGPPVTTSGISSRYFVPFKDKTPMPEKLDQIMAWVDLPIEQRPQLIIAYEPSVDQAGHLAGPDSDLVNAALADADKFALDIHTALAARNLTDIVDIVFVSDHGMTGSSNLRLVYLDDIIGQDGMAAIQHEDGWPSVGIRWAPGTNGSHYLALLEAASAARPEAFQVYTHETMPERFHFTKSPRIAPLYIVPQFGWAITNHHEHEVLMGGDYIPKGIHGYDNDEPSMFAMFVADGPFSTDLKRAYRARTSSWFPWRSLFSSAQLDGWHEVQGNTYVMEGFRNFEIYGLVAKLLNFEEWMVPNNGTRGFWDRYL